MISLEDIKIYLPKYLSPDAEKDLFEELNQFPENIDDRLYLGHSLNPEIIYQGDGINGLLVVNLPDTTTKQAPTMILSNTCDVYQHKRLFPSQLVYSPIFDLDKYEKGLVESGIKDSQAVESHIRSIKGQKVTQVFYLPKGASLQKESMVFLDRINSCDSIFLKRKDIGNIRLFTLSNYGLYLFIFKLSIHLTRITEGIDRSLPFIPS